MCTARICFIPRAAESIFQRPVLVSTNGTLIDDAVINKLASHNVEVQVSLDSPYPEKHNALRGAGVYEKAVENVKKLVNAGVYTILSMVYTRDNLQEFEDYMTLGLELGVHEVRFIPLRLIGGGVRFIEAAPDQYLTFLHLHDILERRPVFKRLLGRDFFSIALTMCRYSAQRINCGLGYKTVFIDADGKVFPCPNHVSSRFMCGNLQENDLVEIVRESPAMNQVRRMFHVEKYTRCRSCAFRMWCAGDCRGEVMALTNDPAAPSPHCTELRKLYKEMLWLIADGITLFDKDADINTFI